MLICNFKILIVDDHPQARDLIRSILRHAGFNCSLADNGRVALAKLKSEHFDLVICDWVMPDLKGIDVLRQIRADEQLKGMPFVLLTAEATKDKVHSAIEAGTTDYIIKPFNADTLIAKLRGIIEKIAPELVTEIKRPDEV
jgi:two-component system chemotaxis response regulator CheY